MRTLLSPALLLLPFWLFAQPELATCSRHSAATYVYRLTEGQAQQLYVKNLKGWEKIPLPPPVDSFPTDRDGEAGLVPGNYLFIRTVEAELQVNLRTIGSLQYNLLTSSEGASMVLHTKEGIPVDDAKVTVGRRNIPFDRSGGCYPLGQWSKSRLVRVGYLGALYFFSVDRHDQSSYYRRTTWGRRWQYKWRRILHGRRYRRYNSEARRFQQHFRSFFVLSKPKYKPGDTVLGKAFIMDRAGRPIERDLALWLTNGSHTNDTLLAKLRPYRPGGYSFSFVLTDSLKLVLDEDYELSLGFLPRWKRAGDDDEDDWRLKKMLSRATLHFEEYDLSSLRLEARADREEQWPGEPLSLYLQALDENDLPVPEARVELTMRSEEIDHVYGQQVFVKDTLWRWEQALDPIGETRIILPDSVFPAASLHYRIYCRLLSSDNEVDNKELSVRYYGDPARIFYHEHGDSLGIEYRRHGKPIVTKARLTGFGRDGTPLSRTLISLPAALRINPMTASYQVNVLDEGDSVTTAYSLGESGPDLTIQGNRTKDTVGIRVEDSMHIPFWYEITMGGRRVEQGYGERLDFRERPRGPAPYVLRLQYLWRGVLREKTLNLLRYEKRLNIAVGQPKSVYPGERVNISVAVTDSRNRPVPDADLTAFGWTAKFKDQPLPSVPYFGRQYLYKAPGRYTVEGTGRDDGQTLPLDWSRWGRVFGLDTLEFYRFLHPSTLYVNSQRMPDGVTQVAPYVSRRGQPEPVHLLYLDERLIYFDQAEQKRYYSFPANPGWHSMRIRVSDRELRLDSLFLPGGTKTIIGINDDKANTLIHIERRSDTLSGLERMLLHQSMLMLQNNFSPNFATIRQGEDRLYLFTPEIEATRSNFFAGPFSSAVALFDVKDRWRQRFNPEGANLFIIQPGLIKEKERPFVYPNGIRLARVAPVTGLADRALTVKIVDSLWQDWLDERSASEDLYANSPEYIHNRGVLQIGGLRDAKGKELFIRKIFVYRYNDADYLRIYRGKARQPGAFEPGSYRVLLLLKGDGYMVHDSVIVRANGLNYYGFDSIRIREADSFSRGLAAMLRRAEEERTDRGGPVRDSLHFLFNDRYIGPTDYYLDATGVITDDRQQPVGGATVMVKGTHQGTVSDEKGRFHLYLPARGTLVVAAVGYDVQERRFTQPGMFTFVLKPSVHALSEVVVVGYGVAKKKELTGSITMLEGRAAGVDVLGSDEAKIDLAEALPPALGAFQALPGMDTVHSIRRRFRDDVFWQPSLRTDANGRVNFMATYPDDITRWSEFFIAVGGHGQTGFTATPVRSAKPLSARLSNPAFLVAGDSAFVIGKLLNYGSDTVTVIRRFSVGNGKLADNPVTLRNARIDTFLLHPAGELGRGERGDSLRISYTLERTGGYFDGEERTIPVMPAGAIETRGHFATLEGDTGLHLHFDPALGPVHVHASANLLPVLLDEIESIRQYEYLCNEQLASKLSALLQKQRIYRLEQHEFKEEKNIREIIGLLMKARKGKALWGWWPDGNGIGWISLHVAEALLSAEKAGYATGLDKQALIDYLVYNFESGTAFDRLVYLRLMQELGGRVDYRRYADSALKHLDRKSLYETLRLMEIQQTAGLLTGLDTLIGKRQFTVLGNCYWGEEGRAFFDNAVEITVLMYRLLRKEGGHEEILRKTRNWLLEQRGTGHWRNTYESSTILTSILPDLLEDKTPPKSPSLTLDGNRIQTFPYEASFPATGELAVEKSGSLPVYFTAYQKFFNPLPARVEGPFVVRTHFEQEGETVDRLRAGKPVALVVEVEALGDADYVLVEAPIPAGCTYAEKSQYFGHQVVHCEYYKNKLSIFCQALSKGTHVFRIQLLPRWTGIYRLNPARAEMMYFPVLYGREGSKRLRIE